MLPFDEISEARVEGAVPTLDARAHGLPLARGRQRIGQRLAFALPLISAKESVPVLGICLIDHSMFFGSARDSAVLGGPVDVGRIFSRHTLSASAPVAQSDASANASAVRLVIEHCKRRARGCKRWVSRIELGNKDLSLAGRTIATIDCKHVFRVGSFRGQGWAHSIPGRRPKGEG
jgi:hypothetical protein